MYTLVNLHPDEKRSRLYAANFLQPGLIPVCTPVRFVETTKRYTDFCVVESGKVYRYIQHKSAASESFEAHLQRYFGASCPQAEIDALSELDKKGIREGKAFIGMTRPGVFFAIGYPPADRNPDLQAPRLVYFKSRFDRMQVAFDDNGVVSDIRD